MKEFQGVSARTLNIDDFLKYVSCLNYFLIHLNNKKIVTNNQKIQLNII